MELSEQKKKFYESVFPSRPNSWEVDEIFELLGELDETNREALLHHVGAIWPVSHSLCFSFLENGIKAVEYFPREMLGEWVRQILGLYESKGLLGARQFMSDVDKYFLGPMRGKSGVAFGEVAAKLSLYCRGISGRNFQFSTAGVPSTDTKTMYLPEFLNSFPGKENNIFLYKLLVSLQWGHVKSRIFSEVLDSRNDGVDMFSKYPDGCLARDLFSALQFIKVFRNLELELPGLVRRGRELCRRLIKKITPAGLNKEKCFALRDLLLWGIGFEEHTLTVTASASVESWEQIIDMGNRSIFNVLPDFYAIFSRLSGSYTLSCASLLLGEFDFTGAGETIRLRRRENEEKFVAMLAGFLEQQAGPRDENSQESEGNNVPSKLQQNLLLLMQDLQGDKKADGKNSIQLDNEGLEIPEELSGLMQEIMDDLGTLPEAYVQAAAGQAGRGINRRETESPNEAEGITRLDVQHIYNEWDYRRAGYRADWCSLFEKTLHPVRSAFVARTLEKYQPQLSKLRRQFEMLRTRDRFIRKRRHGDDIDLDALIEALGDARAGLSPSDRLFIQLLRDERDIATMFLVDMSNSTEGWVGVAVKEALVLLAEALEVVGDRYGIYGFSGMRRSRSELFHVKHLDEPYGTEVRGRIAAIGPKEYTRMGPPIRHLTKKLQDAQSIVRLLVVISDGKPEDYDDYKGQYAIEDTRKALLEARGCGIHPFCITIDKSAHDYLAHMFGRGNYIFVDEVLSLPAKMTEMYRLLTS